MGAVVQDHSEGEAMRTEKIIAFLRSILPGLAPHDEAAAVREVQSKAEATRICPLCGSSIDSHLHYAREAWDCIDEAGGAKY